MTASREQRGSCLIEADALDLGHGGHWQPWLQLTRHTDGTSVSRTFDRLKPMFGTEQAARDYAAELGRSLADQGTALGAVARERKPVAWQWYQMIAGPRACLCRAGYAVFARLMFPVLR